MARLLALALVIASIAPGSSWAPSAVPRSRTRLVRSQQVSWAASDGLMADVPAAPKVGPSSQRQLFCSPLVNSGLIGRTRSILKRVFPQPMKLLRRLLRSRSAVALAIAFTLAFAPAQPARAAAPSPVFDLTIEKGREQKQNIDKSKQTYNYAVCTVAAVTPALVWKAFDNSRKIREAEKKRVTSAIDNLETMRDEWMDVQGKASSDEDMFTGLAARQGELDEDAAAQAEVDAKQALEDAEAEAKAAGLDLDELFDTAEEEAEQEAPPARKARRSGAPGAASSGGDKAELSEEASGEGEKLASSDDVERLKRMFGSS